MSASVNAVPTRQRTERLWESEAELASGGTFTGEERLVAGYGGINIYISSNLSFRLRIEEGCSEDGPWTETDRITSALSELGTAQIITTRKVPYGAHWRIFVDNLGGATMTSFSLCILGLPVGDSATASIAGPDGTVVDVRNADADADGAATLNGFVTNSRIWHFDAEGAADWVITTGTRAESVGGTRTNQSPGIHIYEARESGFSAAKRGRRFYTTHQTPGTVITGQTSFVDTTPTFMVRLAATSIRLILRSISLVQVGTVAGGTVNVTVEIDTADRFSAGGGSVTPQNVNEESVTASGITSFLTNPTATAAGGGTRYVVNTAAAASVGGSLQINFKDGILLSQTSSILVYTWAATTGPSWFFVFEWEEVA